MKVKLGVIGRAAIVVGCILAAGCAGVIPESVRQGVNPNFTFADLVAKPDAARGRRVIFGGEILKVTARSQETEIEILQYPLRSDDSPDRSALSGGRILALWRGSLDPAAYPAGRLLTVAGTVEGSAQRLVEDVQYQYQVLGADYVYLWPRYEALYPPPYYFNSWYPLYAWPRRGYPYWW